MATLALALRAVPTALTRPRPARRRGSRDHRRPQARIFLQPDAPVTLSKPWCAASSGRARSRLQTDSVNMCGSVEFTVGIMVLGIAGQRGGRRQHAFHWAAESPVGLVSRAAWRDAMGGLAWLGGHEFVVRLDSVRAGSHRVGPDSLLLQPSRASGGSGYC